MRAESSRFCWPAPMPSACRSLAYTIALLLTAAHTCHAKTRSRHWTSSGSTAVTTRQSARSTLTRSGSCTSNPPSIGRTSNGTGEGAVAVSTRTFLRSASVASASASYPGATTTSVNTGARAVAIAFVTGRLTATIPPNALTGSQALAFT